MIDEINPLEAWFARQKEMDGEGKVEFMKRMGWYTGE